MMRQRFTTLTAACCMAALLGATAGCGSDGGTEPFQPPPTTGTPSPTPSPTPPPAGDAGPLTPPFAGKVAFVSRRNAAERETVFVMDPDGSRVTEVPLNRPDGRPFNLRSKFAGNRFMNAAGTHFVLSVLGFFAGSATESRTYLMNTDGSDVREITALLDPDTPNPWSTLTEGVSLNEDGSRLVFAYGGFSPNGGSRVPYSVVTMRADGGERTVRYTAPSTDVTITAPAFAPDGGTLYFVEEGQQAIGEDGITRVSGEVRRLGPGATEPVTVARVTRRTEDFRVRFGVGVSPDGARLVFVSEADGSAEVFTVNADGTGLRRLTSHPARDINPAFTSDGQKIVFGSDRDGNEEIYSMNPDGSGVTRLTFDITSDEEPTTRGRGQK